MIRLIEALNYRCLRYVKQELKDFHLLVGPNASGKTTFLDVVAFLGGLVSGGLDEAIGERTSNFYDLLFGRQGTGFQLAIELEIPEEIKKKLIEEKEYRYVRYEVAVGLNSETGKIGLDEERVLLFSETKSKKGKMVIIRRERRQGKEFIWEHSHDRGKTMFTSVRPNQSILAYSLFSETTFPVSSWLKETMRESIQKIILNSRVMMKSSPPGQGYAFKPDGSNLPWVIDHFKTVSPILFREWVQHVRTACPDLMDIETVERPEDRHKYLKLIYNKKFGVPSWMASEGTLRLLALTLPAYLTDFKGIYLIEEPENGIHPQAMETVFQSLSSVYSAQILMATHSPVFLSHAKPEDVICFNKDESGATDTVLGSQHPRLKDWHGEVSFDVLYASGVLS